jgi:hypothetical protein
MIIKTFLLNFATKFKNLTDKILIIIIFMELMLQIQVILLLNSCIFLFERNNKLK